MGGGQPIVRKLEVDVNLLHASHGGSNLLYASHWWGATYCTQVMGGWRLTYCTQVMGGGQPIVRK